ncbi:MAG: alpha/beta hydrolase [Deltaproteobacteria bacterium]|nr:alpha/beta hydrolase [Deltaproteobacteria bacterium]MBM4322802.1 alpha/beta hydrolase [Deltaproteobacteria bacterium]MBM4346791.1 alpha/beta hydrolase [Deltaproteobacteria bacterium]
MPIERIIGSQISYWVSGKGFTEGREFVLFIHGAGGGQYTWSYQKGYFEKEFNLIIIELPGHGESGGEGEIEIGKYAEHVYGFIKALRLSKVFFVGHSMGGAIVQTMALRYPEIIKGIVLVGTGAKLRVFPLILNEIKENFEEAVKKINEFAYSRKASPDLIKKGMDGMRLCRPEVIHGDFSACDRFNVMNEVEKINLPTLIICGDEDELTPLKYSQFLQNKIKGSRLEVISGAGHMVMMEAPSLFNAKIKEFLLNPTFYESK